MTASLPKASDLLAVSAGNGSHGWNTNAVAGSTAQETTRCSLFRHGLFVNAATQVFCGPNSASSTLKFFISPEDTTEKAGDREAVIPTHQRVNIFGMIKTTQYIEYEDASPEVREVYDDIMTTRKVDWVNNFWKALAAQPELLRRTWRGVKTVMAPGAIDALTKEMLYVAVSVTNGCRYCINSHTAAARKKGLTDDMLSELMAVVGMANQTNALANGFQLEVDEAFHNGGRNSD